VLNPAESIGKEVLMYGWNDAVPDAQVELVGTSVEVTGGFHNLETPTDVNDDGRTTPLDVLTCVNALSAFGLGRMEDLRPLLADAAGSINNHLDVNDDGTLAPLDALMIINELNGRSGSEPTNKGVDRPVRPLAGWADWKTLDSRLHADPVAPALARLGLEPDEAVDLVHEVLVGIDVEALHAFDPNDWVSWDADALHAVLQPAFEKTGVEVAADELTWLVDDLASVVDHVKLGAILPGLDVGVDRTTLETAFRGRFFRELTDRDFLADLLALDLAGL
jgi:hypothetical protein